MAKVEINTPAPDFELTSHQGEIVRLAQFRQKASVLLVFNRGFT